MQQRILLATPRRRRAFTLVEMLVVILVIVILATVVLSAMVTAQETAKIARTKALIARMDQWLAPLWDAYQTRRVPVIVPVGTSPQAAAKARLDALRDIMRLELPDRVTDVLDGPTTSGMARPALSEAYKRAVAASWSTNNTHQGAECLYLILSRTMDGDVSALEFFQPTEIGDVDADGAKEILDGWGKPIEFLRWAPGFVSPMQTGGEDAFDPRKVYGKQYLYPLIFSAGSDMTYDIKTDVAGGSDPSTWHHYNATTPQKNDPYVDPGGSGVYFGASIGPGSLDNITNQFFETGN
ncbi:MAG: prepilin-type N-terminal cleavage/methylation domain-containing protein [Planctomycetales bacterium]|nr:prepilin-type N-terminal cleavage/methylation domain-containing protein [Planctomycetales bacterium]